MNLLRSLDISSSALTAERLRMDVISNNIANANTTRTPEGGPYRRQMVVFAPRGDQKFKIPVASENTTTVGNGVRVVGVVNDQSPVKLVYDPQNPDANADGYVSMPNVNIVTEMVDMISATRAYEANVTALNAAKSMAMKALEIGR